MCGNVIILAMFVLPPQTQIPARRRHLSKDLVERLIEQSEITVYKM
jgi:hypothetical protein